MKTRETINIVCSELGTTKAQLAKKMGVHPSSLYRKLARDSMTFEELQNCLEILGVSIEFSLRYPDGKVQSSRDNYEMVLERMELLEKELEAARKAELYQKKTLKELRTELNSAVGYTELGLRPGSRAEEYLEKLQITLTSMEKTIAYTLGEVVTEESEVEDSNDLESLSGKRVLLVEDHQLNREIMKEVLLGHCLVVEEAQNGSEAFALVKENEPGYYDFILMDIEMPVMDGYQATMKIRKLPNRIRANIPIIALTADADPETREKATVVGMDDYLVKPVNSSRLLRSLAKFQ